MNPLHFPWLETSIAVALLGALCVSRLHHPNRASIWGIGFTGTAFACTVLASLGFYLNGRSVIWSIQPWLFGRHLLGIDSLNAPMVPVVALLHFLTAVATARTKMRRFSFSWSLTSEAIRLATFACTDPWALIVLLTVCVVPPYLELVNRGRPTRVYVLHMALFVGLLVAGWISVEARLQRGLAPGLATVPLLAAVLIRCGAVPAHCWLTDWFEHASFGNALLFVTPLPGVYAAVRLVLPIAPDAVLQCLGLVSLVTAVYAAGMAVVQSDVRRFFAYLFLSHASLVLVGLELRSATSLTGALCLWLSILISLGGFGLTLRALEARYGRLALTNHHGLYEHSPTLAVSFLLTGLASVGFPGTVGFVCTDLLVDGAIKAHLSIGLAVIAAAALNGIAVLRAYFLLFTGTRHVSSVSLRIGGRERFAVLTLAALILGGGAYPQPGVSSRQQAADEILAASPPQPHLAQQADPLKAVVDRR